MHCCISSHKLHLHISSQDHADYHGVYNVSSVSWVTVGDLDYWVCYWDYGDCHTVCDYLYCVLDGAVLF